MLLVRDVAAKPTQLSPPNDVSICLMRFECVWCRYENPEIALNCGMMLRECVRHEPLCKIVLYSEEFYKFFGFVEVSTFDIASDAFSTFKVSITVGTS